MSKTILLCSDKKRRAAKFLPFFNSEAGKEKSIIKHKKERSEIVFWPLLI